MLFSTAQSGLQPVGPGGLQMSSKTGKAQKTCMRREPLEQGRDGLVEGHFKFHFSAKHE